MASVPTPDPGPRHASGDPWAAGPVTRLGTAAARPVEPAADPVADGSDGPVRAGPRIRQPIWWFAGAAGAILAVGLILVLVGGMSDGLGRLAGEPRPPTDRRPPLARACPPPTATPADPDQAPPAEPTPGAPPTGARTLDEEAGISYAAFGAPWEPWSTVWRAGTLRVPYKVGQHFVTEPAYNGFSDYHASILSAAVPAADNDALVLDLECVGRQVAADVRAEYYPQPNTTDVLRDELRTLGGRPAWVSVFRLHFSQPGLRATDELAAVACIDVGRPTAAILYVSIPGTHRHLDWVVDAALASVRPT